MFFKIVNHFNLSHALREKWREGYSSADLKADLLAGIIVALVAIPLAMSLAIASGVAPQYGLYTVIVGGTVIALLGGSRLQVSGPTAAFVVVLAPISQNFGFQGLLLAGFLAGIILIFIGAAKLGKLIAYIPHPVTTGFTSGIAIVIATIQIKDFFGLQFSANPENYFDRIRLIASNINSILPTETAVGLTTLIILIAWPKYNKKIPSPIIALGSITLLTAILTQLIPDFHVATIGSRFTFEHNGEIGYGIPNALPSFILPWSHPEYTSIVDYLTLIKSILPSALTIALLGGIESLLSAVVADGMAGTKHDPNVELIALGVGNLLCPFFGGIAATGAIARTATNIKFGARSPLSAVLHALFTLLIILTLAEMVSYLPIAALAALLLVVAYNMSGWTHFFHILKVAPKNDIFVLITCFSLTVVFDMVIGVISGMVLAALLLVNRVASMTHSNILKAENVVGTTNLHPAIKGFLFYEIRGPLLFGAAERAINALSMINDDVQAVAFLLDRVDVMDITGLTALETAINKLRKQKIKIYMVGMQKQPAELLKRSYSNKGIDDITFVNHITELRS